MGVTKAIADLRQQIHDDLRTQHPEWILPNGESPMCDAYEARLMDLLALVPGLYYDDRPGMAAHRKLDRAALAFHGLLPRLIRNR